MKDLAMGELTGRAWNDIYYEDDTYVIGKYLKTDEIYCYEKVSSHRRGGETHWVSVGFSELPDHILDNTDSRLKQQIIKEMI